ncbi:adenylyl-sulfate kinase [Rhizobium sp. JAB6]|nr:adenylyl-sulfate kinase [Rhizobium sp. JAB6]
MDIEPHDGFPPRPERNISPQLVEVAMGSRAKLMNQKPAVLWFTGLSGAGKSTIANHLKKLLNDDGRHTILLDGDHIRRGLNSDLGFAEADRAENIRRIAEVTKLMTEAGLIVIVACISPFRSGRQFARDLMEPGEFIEIFVDAPLEECIQRDPKGLYKRALSGELHHFTGIDSPYEPPECPELHLRTAGADPAQLARKVETFLRGKFY